MRPPTLTVVIPVFNEEACLAELHRRLSAALDDSEALPNGYELLFVDDGSEDESPAVLLDLHRRDPVHVRVMTFSRNFGHEMATTAGLRYARGDAVVLIDADLQDPPELIPTLLARWREGYELVYAQRSTRAGEPWLKRMSSYLFYRLLRRLAGINLPDDTGDFRLMDRKVVDAFNRCPERNRYVRGLTWWTGFRRVGVPFERDARFAGETKYNYLKLARLAMDSIAAFSVVPLRIASFTGGLVGIGSLVYMAFVVLEKLRGRSPQPGYALLASAVLLLGSMILMTLGIIGEYIGRIYQEVQGRPQYLVREWLGFEDLPRPADLPPSVAVPTARPDPD